jgi:replicative DNA helicase
MADTKERMPRSLQENLITLLAWSDEHGKLISELTHADSFEGLYREIAERCIGFWRQHGKAPKHHLPDLLNHILEEPKDRRAANLRSVLHQMYGAYRAGINTDYVVQECRTFAELQGAKRIIIEVADRLADKQELALPQVKEMLAKLFNTHHRTFDPGLVGTDLSNLYRHLERREGNEFITGIQILDQRHVVPTRGTIMVFLAVTGAGKSWWLIELGFQALLRHRKVAHVTLELSDDEIQKRYYQTYLQLAAYERDLTVPYTKLLVDRDDKLIGFKRGTRTAAYSMQKPNRRELKKFVDYEHSLKNLRIKQFPTRQLTVSELRGYLNALEATGFLADLLVVDYAGLMRTDEENYRISLGRLVEELRGLAGERHLALVTAQQVNREGSRADQVRMTHVAEDWSIPGTADFVLALTRTDKEKAHKLARLSVTKNRDGVDGFGVVLSQNYHHGQFHRNSVWLDRDYESLLEQLK